MKMNPTKLPHQIKTISQYHQVMGLPKPEHPLISILNFDSIPRLPVNEPLTFVYDFYSIYLKRISNVKFKYGQQESDFDEGVLFFMAPNQVFTTRRKKARMSIVLGGSCLSILTSYGIQHWQQQ